MNWIVSEGAKVQGASHKIKGMPCQDAVQVHPIKGSKSPSYCVIMSVADGHGSSASKYSDDGAYIATEVAIKHMKQVAQHIENELIKEISRDIEKVLKLEFEAKLETEEIESLNKYLKSIERHMDSKMIHIEKRLLKEIKHKIEKILVQQEIGNSVNSDEEACRYFALKQKEICRYFLEEERINKNLYEYLSEIGALRIPKLIDHFWKKSVKSYHKKQNREEIKADEDRESKKANHKKFYKMYGTTLLMSFISKEFIFSLQIGDGTILAIDEVGEARYFIKPEKLLGTETHSLCLENSWKYFKSRLLKFCDDGSNIPKMLMLSTDGYGDSFESESDFFEIGKDYLSRIEIGGMKEVDDNLEAWLDETSKSGSGDDISVVLAYRE